MADPATAAAVRRVQAGDVEAFAEVVRAYQRPLRAWISRGCAPGLDADDLAHRAFITAFRSISDFAADGNCFAWLCAIARNHLRDEVKRLRRSRTVPIGALQELADLELAGVDDAEAPDERRLAALRACLQRLPAAMAELVERHYVRQMRLDSIAAELGTSLGAVKVRLHAIRRKLHDCVTARLAVEE